MGLFSFLHAPCREEAERSAIREAALRGEIHKLTDRIIAMADLKAHAAVNHEGPPPRTEEEKARRPALRIPPYVNGLSRSGHVDLASIRRNIDERNKSRNAGKPPVVSE